MRTLGTLLFQLGPDIFQALKQIFRRRFARCAGIGETNLIRQSTVPEENGYFSTGFPFDIIRPVEIIRLLDSFISITGKTANSKRLCQYRFTGCHPLVTSLRHQWNDFLRNRSFTGP